MVRTIITPADTDVHLLIAKEYVGKRIEITYLALDELEQMPTLNKQSLTSGIQFPMTQLKKCMRM